MYLQCQSYPLDTLNKFCYNKKLQTKMKAYLLFIIAFFFIDSAWAQKASTFHPQAITDENIFASQDYYHWGGSIIKDPHGQYHLFYSRWKKTYTFYGWLTHSEIAHATSTHPAGPWEYQETVLKGRGVGSWDAITAHNPKIKYFEGKYYLYYISTNLDSMDYSDEDLIKAGMEAGHSSTLRKELRYNQRTGVALAPSLKGPWHRKETPLLEPDGPITNITVNPAITQGHDHRYYLVVKGDKPNETNFVRNQAIATSNNPDRDFKIEPDPVIGDLDTEDMSIWFSHLDSTYYGVYHAHTYIGLIKSKDGIQWKRGSDKIMEKKIQKANGDVLVPDRMERPFVFIENDEPKVLMLAVKKGAEAFSVFIPLK